MKIDPATNPVAADALRLPASEVAIGPRAMFFATTSAHPMLRGPMVAYAPEDDAGVDAGGGESTPAPAGDDTPAAEVDDDRQPNPDGDDDPEVELDDQGEPIAKAAEDDDTEEVEHDGKKYKLPKALKPALLMQADYTRKTQELADERRTHAQELETQRTALTQQAEVVQSMREDVAKVETLKAQVAHFAGVNWDQAYEEAETSENPTVEYAKVVRAYAKYQALQADVVGAEKTLNEKIDAHLKSQEDQRTQRIQDVGKVLAEKIPDFGREKAQALMEFAAQEGVTVQEMQAVDDPRTWLLLNRAHALQAENAALKAQLATKTTVDRHAKAQDTTPAASVKGNAAPDTGLRDTLNNDEWMRKRNAQVEKRRKQA